MKLVMSQLIRAQERRIRSSEVRFVIGTQMYFIGLFSFCSEIAII